MSEEFGDLALGNQSRTVDVESSVSPCCRALLTNTVITSRTQSPQVVQRTSRIRSA